MKIFFAHRLRHANFVDAAVNGAYEVLPAVVSSVCTTIIAFVPLMFVAGIRESFHCGDAIAVIAIVNHFSLFGKYFYSPLSSGSQKKHVIYRP